MLILSSQLLFSAKLNSPPIKQKLEREREYLRPDEVEAMIDESHLLKPLERD
jgi:hypothetical protein